MTFQADKPSGNVVLTVEKAAIGYNQHVLSEPINLDVHKLDAIAIVGPNGIGKSTLIKSVIGQIPFIKGEVKYGANVEIGYYDQTQSHLTSSNTVLEELWQDFSTTPEVDIRNRLGAFLFSGDDVKNRWPCCQVEKKPVCFLRSYLWKTTIFLFWMSRLTT